MGYTADGDLADLFPDIVEPWAQRTAQRVEDRLYDEVTRRTPVAEMPEAYGVRGQGGKTGWIRDRKGRTPGTAKRSWKKSGVRRISAGRYMVDVDSDDPVMIYIENDTRPHLIRARKPRGVLRFPMGLTFLYRREVHHPGTEGVHMMRDSLAVIDATWQEVANEVFDELDVAGVTAL